MRKSTALIAAIALLGSLTACSAGPRVDGCSPVVTAGAASALIAATGPVGTAPTVTFPTPLFTKTTQSSTLIPGRGAPIGEGQPVILDVTILDAATGATVQKTTYSATGGSLITVGKSSFPAVSEGLKCAKIGSRVAIIGSAKDSHGGTADPANGIGKDDSFIYVVDVKNAFPAKATGADQLPVNGMPSVVRTEDGTPGIIVPTHSAPTGATVELLRAGSGATVQTNQFLVLKYTAIGWKSKTVFDSTWTGHQATVLQLGSAAVSPGLDKALLGQRVGSQVLAVLPPKDAAVAGGSGKAPTDDASVYVVDILGIAG